MSLTLYFLRHGQTALSREDVFCGSGSDPELTEDGLKMAESFAAAYRSKAWRAIYSSPLRRAVATARPLADALTLDIEERDGLKEIGYGLWERLSKEAVEGQFHDDYISWLADPSWHAPTGGETAVLIARRGMHVVEAIRRRFDDGNVLVVSHKATIRIMLCCLLGIDVGRFRYRMVCPVGSVSVVEFTAHGPLLHVLADRSHLDERQRSLPGT
ncbi:MAG TPA: histidine phosphatase family protein [Pyrinomonadaceae bacterium]|nr:histidine phosphatase family protein [Pyrinomonadaceae bacterium]